MKLRSVEVFHTPPLPAETRQVPADFWVQPRGNDWVLGVMKDPDDRDYLLLANRDHQHRRWAVLQLQRPQAQVDKFDKQAGKWLRLDTYARDGYTYVDFILAAGDGELLRVR